MDHPPHFFWISVSDAMETSIATSNTQEPNITEIVGLFLQNKLRIFLIVGGVVLVGVAMSFVLPRQYQASELIQLATMDSRPIESEDEIMTFFGTDITLREIATALHLSSPEVRDRLALRGRNEGRFMEIRGKGPTPEEAMATTQLVSKMVLARSQGAYQPARDIFEKEIVTLFEEQAGTRKEIVRLEKVGERLATEATFYQSEIVKRSDAQSEAQGRIVETYIRLLADTKMRQDETAQAIESAKQRLIVLEETMQRKRSSIAYALRPPTVEAAAVMPRASSIPPLLIQNVIYSTVLGVFLSIVWILVREYHIERTRQRQHIRGM